MKKSSRRSGAIDVKLVSAVVLLLFAGGIGAANLPDILDGAQAVTLSGKPLYAAAPGQKTLEQLADKNQ